MSFDSTRSEMLIVSWLWTYAFLGSLSFHPLMLSINMRGSATAAKKETRRAFWYNGTSLTKSSVAL